MSADPPALSSTAYGVLGLLSLREWTAYELEQQATRSLRFISPRARSVIYAEPKRLVRLGLAAASHESRGRRRVAVYAITDSGRAALRSWYGTPVALPTLEAPVLMRTLFAAGGDRDLLLRTLRDSARDAAELLAGLQRQGGGYHDGGGPFPDRLPFIALNGTFLLGWLTWVRDWSEWAAERIEQLPDDPDGRRTDALQLLDALAEGRFPADLGPIGGTRDGTSADRHGRPAR